MDTCKGLLRDRTYQKISTIYLNSISPYQAKETKGEHIYTHHISTQNGHTPLFELRCDVKLIKRKHEQARQKRKRHLSMSRRQCIEDMFTSKQRSGRHNCDNVTSKEQNLRVLYRVYPEKQKYQHTASNSPHKQRDSRKTRPCPCESEEIRKCTNDGKTFTSSILRNPRLMKIKQNRCYRYCNKYAPFSN